MSHAEERWNATRAVLRARQGEPPLVRRASDPAPASFAQEGLWLLDRLRPGDGAYNLTVACRLRGPLDVRALGDALVGLVARHDVLRTSLAMVDGQLCQQVGPAPASVLRAEAVPSGDARAWAAARAAEPFALARGPLFRAHLAELAEHDHCLLLANHHAVMDAWSFELFMHELCAGYEARRRGRPAPLPPSLQYGDFAAWQRQQMSGERLDRLVAHWRTVLPREVPTLALPGDWPRKSGLNGRGASLSRRYDRTLTAALRSLARGEGATLYMVLLAAFEILLYRASGDGEVMVGSPVAIRTRPELGSMLGLLTNTLVLPARLAGTVTFRRLLVDTRQTVSEALAHQALPFEILVRELGRHRYAGSPLFQVMFALQNVPRSHWRWPGLTCEAWDVEPARAKFDLTLTMQEERDGLSAVLAYDADLFAPSTAEHMLDHFGRLLASVAADPDQRISRTSLLSTAERSRELAAARGPTRTCAGSVHRRLEAQARRAPAATALVGADGETLGYGDLNRRANRLARRLRGVGLGRGAVVGVCLPRSPALIVAELAVLKAGAAYLPIADVPPARAQRLLQGAAAAVTAAAWRGRLSSVSAPQILVDEAPDADEAARDDADLDDDGSPDDLAYVMFTSGSTGEPRGVCIPHRGIIRLVVDADYVHLAPDEVLLQLAPVAFDAATFEIWGALLNGAKLVLAPAQPLSVAEVGALVSKHRVTTLWLTAGLFELVVDSGLEHLGSLRQLLTGGDVVSVRHARRFRERWPDCRLLNCYGPTENTTFTTVHAVDVVEPERSLPIGRPIANTTLHILDDELAPVPRGVVGEAFLGGEGLARGYLGDPRATGERFVPSPFHPGETLYRSGDRVRRRADGLLEFVGRRDDEVKIRGFRIDPAEVEQALQHHPAVKRALVCAEGEGTRKQLCAYVVAEPADAELPLLLRRMLRAGLPDAMVPSAITLVPALPISDNGKRRPPRIRESLSVPARGATPTIKQGAQPRDTWEGTVARAFARVLGGAPVGMDDSFFDKGGDSLAAIRLVGDLERELRRPVALATLYENPTVAELACALRAAPAAVPLVEAGVLTLKAGRTARPLFLLAGGRGGKPELTICAKLVSRLDADETVVGLLAPPVGAPVEDSAATHLATIKRVQPRGPYRVGGECIGGVIAYEVAQQLWRRGDAVELLLLLDSWCPTGDGRVPRRSLGQWLAPQRWLDKSAELMRAGLRFWAELPQRSPDAMPWPRELWQRLTVPREVQRHMAACMRYRPPSYPGPVTIVASAASLRRGLAGPWRALAAGGVVIHEAPGDHESYSRRYYRQTAEQLRVCLERQRREEGDRGDAG